MAPTPLMADARRAGLQVWPYTFRPENHFLPAAQQEGGDPSTRNEAGALVEIRVYLALGIGGSDSWAYGSGACAEAAPNDTSPYPLPGRGGEGATRMTRNGKIARLPRDIRNQLNQRIADGEPGVRLVEWTS